MFSDDNKKNVMKSRIVSLIFRQLSSRLSLSKNQNNQIVDFMKSMVVFVSPSSEEVSRRFFASHDSCKRQSLKDEERKHLLCKRYMDECLFFSIAVDTAQFRNEHYMSCIIRFSFDNKMIQLPLFITPCLDLSGKDLACFVFDKLRERNARFDKFTSIATDGAASMVGRFNGMTTMLKRLVEQFCRDKNLPSPSMHSVWCFSHRLNLVTKSFLTSKPVNAVLAFADWFANKRRQVSYKRFLTVRHGNSQLRVIPQPSETRWVYYRDLVSAIISQARQVDEFVSIQPDFLLFWNGLRKDCVKYGPCVEHEFSLNNRQIKATFDFTNFFLELLGRTNSVFQERFSTVGELWEIVVSLKMKVNSFIIPMGGTNSTTLECLSELTWDEAAHFQRALIQLHHNLEMRFPIPSMSFDLKRRHLFDTSTSQPNHPTFQHEHCSVLPVVSFMNFPHHVVNKTSFRDRFPEKTCEEVRKMANEINIHKEEIIRVNRERKMAVSQKVGFDVVTAISVTDAFTVLDSQQYPLLWTEYLKANTIVPTTVSCEQSFSVTKHAIHTNMKPVNFIANVTNKLYEKATTKWF